MPAPPLPPQADNITVVVAPSESRTIVVAPSEVQVVSLQAVINPVQQTLSGLSDVNTASKIDGSVLSYDTTAAKWQAVNVLREQLMDGGNF
jgi:hypothetical protein